LKHLLSFGKSVPCFDVVGVESHSLSGFSYLAQSNKSVVRSGEIIDRTNLF
jgi:hypothetical protein